MPRYRGFGWLEDGPDERGAGPAHALFATVYAPGDVSILVHPDILDQGVAQSCVAHALASALRDRLIVQGRRADPSSRLWIYRKSRARHGATGLDIGTYFRTAVEAVEEEGVCAESWWPYDPAHVYDAPPIDAARHAYDQRSLVRLYRCSDDGEERESDIRRALAHGFPLVAGFAVDQGFLDAGGEVWDASGRILGRHAVEIVGASGPGVIIRNSWGTDWGVSGWGKVGWPTVRNPNACSDVYAVEAVPMFSESTS